MAIQVRPEAVRGHSAGRLRVEGLLPAAPSHRASVQVDEGVTEVGAALCPGPSADHTPYVDVHLGLPGDGADAGSGWRGRVDALDGLEGSLTSTIAKRKSLNPEVINDNSSSLAHRQCREHLSYPTGNLLEIWASPTAYRQLSPAAASDTSWH